MAGACRSERKTTMIGSDCCQADVASASARATDKSFHHYVLKEREKTTMKSMRWKIALSVLWLSLLFNIERLDFDKGTNVNLTSSFYVLATATAILFLVVAMSRRFMYILGGGIFLAY